MNQRQNKEQSKIERAALRLVSCQQLVGVGNTLRDGQMKLSRRQWSNGEAWIITG
jgi:hypothetical protein